MPRVGAQFCRLQCILPHQHAVFTLHARLRSGSARSLAPKPTAPARKHPTPDNTTMQRKIRPKIDSARKASLVLNSLRKSVQSPDVKTNVQSPTRSPVFDPLNSPIQDEEPAGSGSIKQSEKGQVEEPETIEISEKELAIQMRIAERRRKVLWPGIWTLFALAGTYGTLAYLDVKNGIPSSDGSHLPERAQLPQTWYLTPTVIREGIVAGWRELDSLTIGIVVASVAIHLLKRSPLPIWEKLIHVTGEAKWTAFTYPLLNSNWTHLALNMAALVWLLPGVVHYFDGDLFHTSAFLVSVPLITSYLTHFAYRFNMTQALVLNVGASGAIFAAFGVYCIAYAKEKLWVPTLFVLRLDAREWGLMFVLYQAYNMMQASKSGNRPAFLVHLISFALGMAYAHFNLKHHLWIPLVSEISSTQKSSNETEK
ncbi:uncharacterized protein M421DRAFT_69736 [Didymella exigua CBS 183.55]|uniref:Peptidase S54 rhomboid domain-containing protein n=1 Tax=Didymella exigua CBS 183.55 TaxID=1150837 RepID=A0A6A5RBC0_9PLEO|nr:uncharacterized protein M421DRAFT_69736 [Didymella exigua CBS 183.55]KAF1925535.1 hypothetical protein M421DRAFT_69736 [Didymella exigua CBS 183.55]